jgi:eukaryotic-like serine/threonine-protein kinase
MLTIDQTRWQAISPLLDELLDADETQRTARLLELRTADPTLADDVAALLAYQPAVTSEHFLEGTASDQAQSWTLAGQTIGDYTLDRSIGEGGMGTVWLARRSDGHYEGQAAVKFLNLALLNRGGVERFRRESNVLAKLAHPNITHLIDAGIAAGQPYIVLEYVEGERIDRWCDAQVLDTAARVRLFLQVLSAVSHAHSRLILHRDLKPSNILVTSAGRAKLLDFGMAKLLEDDGAEASAAEVTAHRGHAFTPEYAAPEQVQRSEATTVTDVYALGVLLYVLLTGTHPTARDTATPAERLRAVVEHEPVRPSEAALKGDPALARARASSPVQLARVLRGDLDNIIAKALKKSRIERYPTVEALADDLRRYLKNEPVSARADSVGYRVRKFACRHRTAVATSSVAVVAMIATSAVAVWQMVEANERRAEAEFEARQARASHDLLYLVYSDPAVSPDATTMLERLAKVREVILQSNDDPQIKVPLLLQLGGRYLELSALDQLLDLLKEVRQLAAADGNPRQQAVIACGFGNVYASLGRFDEARRELELAAEHLRKVRTEDLDTRAECLAAESHLATVRGDFDRAVKLARQGVALFEARGRTTDSRYTTSVNQLSIGYMAMGDFPRAYANIRKAREVTQQQGLRDTQRDLVEALQEIQLLNLGGKPAAALDLISGLLANPRVAKVPEVPRFVLDQHHGVALLRLARYSSAVAAFEAAHEGARLAGHHNFMLLSSVSMLDALAQSGRMDEAQQRLATPAAQHEIDKASPAGVVYLVVKARIALAQGAIPQADEWAQQALSSVRQRNQRTDAQLRGVTVMAARTALARRDWSTASDLARAAVEVARAEAIDPQSSAFVGEALLLKAEAERGAGQVARAAESASQALPHLQQNLSLDHPMTQAAHELLASAR